MFRRRLPILALPLLAVALVASGCGEQSPTSPGGGITQQQADDIAVQMAASLSADNGGAMTELSAAADAATSAQAGAAFGTASAESETTFTHGDITYEFTQTFFDANGDPLPGYDSTAVRMRVTSRAYGTVTSERYQATIGHAALLDLTGLQETSEVYVFDGAADDTLESEFTAMDDSGLRYFSWTSAADYDAVTLLKDRQANPWPLSGSARWVVEAIARGSSEGNDIEARYDASVEVTFNGTRYPEIVVNERFRYRVDLQTGEVTAV